MTHLPDVVVEPVVVAAIATPDVEIGGETMPGVTVAGFRLDAQTIDAGCVIEYAAPGGCLGAVEITAASIPRSRSPPA